jgi:hypothetical protein
MDENDSIFNVNDNEISIIDMLTPDMTILAMGLKPTKKASGEYAVSNRELYPEIIVSKGTGVLTRRAEKLLLTLANKAIAKKTYYNPDDKNDCLQTGIMNIFLNWSKFNPDKSNNAFAYFTEIFKRGIAQGFNDIYRKKGDPNNEIKVMSMNNINNGEGIYNV